MLACSLLINIIKSRCKPNFVGKEEEEAKQREKMLYALSIKHDRKASMQKTLIQIPIKKLRIRKRNSIHLSESAEANINKNRIQKPNCQVTF